MDLIPYIKSGYSILYLLTAEESRAEMVVLENAKECKRKIKVWSFTDGFIDPSDKDYVDHTEDPQKALVKIKNEPPATICVFRDFHNFMDHPKVKRHLRDIAKSFKQSRKTMIIISPVNKIPPELERDITLIEFELPKKDEIKVVFDNLYKSNKKALGEIEDEEQDRAIEAAMGLTTGEAENAFSKAWRENHETQTPISQIVLAEKAATVKKSGILEYFQASTTANDIGGLANLKKWLDIRSKSFSKKAREFGLPMPKGTLFVGLPGCGKSLTAKATSQILGVPLIRFDIGRVFGGLVGQSEENMRTAIQTAEAIGNCVLWIDEMEKAFGGMTGGSGDNGVSKRVFGNFITWLQEKTCPVFIVATVNRIEEILQSNPELLRKGRFDEIFFVGLPSEDERKEIFGIHIKKYGRVAKDFNLDALAKASKQFSGAEIEESVISGLHLAFHHDRDLTDEDILKAIKNTNPLAKTASSQLTAMASWAAENAVNASACTTKKAADGTQAGRQLEL